MVKADKLTLKQQKWLEIYLKTGNATEAARRAYTCNDRSARQIGYENMTKLDFTEVLEAQGATIAMLVKALIEGAKATRLIKANLIVQKDKGAISDKELVEAARELNGVYMEVEDWAVRHRYLVTILRMRKMYPQHKDKPNNNEEPTRIVFKPFDTNRANLIA